MMTIDKLSAPPRIPDAPGLKWRPRKNGWVASWECRGDIASRGYEIKTRRILYCTVEPTEAEVAYVQGLCHKRQTEMLIWSRGGLPESGAYDGTIRTLVYCYQTDRDSTYRALRYRTRINHDSLLRRIVAAHGDERVEHINARALKSWHAEWKDGNKVAMAHAFMGQIRTLFSFGFTLLECTECKRCSDILGEMRFPMSKPRKEALSADQAIAIRAEANKQGWHSIALAQAFQFDLTLRQKDVIGEWVPVDEPEPSDVIDYALGNKWLRGLRWSEINSALILRHTTSKKDKDIEVDLRLAPMVMEELQRFAELPASGPIVVCEGSGKPWCAVEFRRRWRQIATAVGVPAAVYNMDSRAGAITEATDSGASLEDVRHAATHSNIATTQKYSRGAAQKTAQVMQLRVAHRNKNAK